MRLVYAILCLHFLHVTCDDTKSNNNEEEELEVDDQWMLTMFKKNYAKRIPPYVGPDDDPVVITVTINLEAITVVDEAKMYFEADLILLLKWDDGRLSPQTDFNNKKKNLEPSIVGKLWVPELIFRNCRSCEMLNIRKAQNRYLILNTTLETSFRVTEKFFCNFILRNYPMDQQMCTIKLENAYDDVSESKLVANENMSRNIMNENSLPQYDITELDIANCTLDFDNTDSMPVSCVQLTFVMSRLIQHHIMLTFIPSTLVVMISWISFWLDVESVPARTALGLTGLLTLTTQFANVQRSLPPVSYMKAIDMWMLTCMFAVFASLVEFAIVNYIHRRKNKIEKVASQLTKTLPPNRILVESRRPTLVRTSSIILREHNFVRKRTFKKTRLSAPKLDKYLPRVKITNIDWDLVSRVLFPLTFLLFNVGFWLKYYNY